MPLKPLVVNSSLFLVCVSVSLSVRLFIPFSVLCMLLISQTMATYDEMSFRAICQKTVGVKKGRVATERSILKERGDWRQRKERWT